MEDNKTYSVYCHTCPNGMQYFGMSGNVKKRWNPSGYKNSTSFYDAIERFGWKNIRHEVIATDLTRDEALKLEDQLIDTARANGTSLNMVRSGHHTQTDEYKDERKDYDKEYYENNREDRIAYGKSYYEEHREERKAYQREYNKRKKEQNKKSPPPIF